LAREDQGAPAAVCPHSGKCTRYRVLADSSGLVLEPADEIFSSLSEKEIYSCIRRSTNLVYRIALGAQEVSRIPPELLVSHLLHILQNQRALATPPQRGTQSPEPDPAAHP